MSDYVACDLAHWVLAIGYERADVLYLDLRRSMGTWLYSVCSSFCGSRCQAVYTVRLVSPSAMIFAFATKEGGHVGLVYSLTSGKDIYSHMVLCAPGT